MGARAMGVGKMSEPLKVISLQRHLLARIGSAGVETTVGSRGNHGWFAWFVWGGYYLAMTPAAGAESEVGDAPAGAVAYAPKRYWS